MKSNPIARKQVVTALICLTALLSLLLTGCNSAQPQTETEPPALTTEATQPTETREATQPIETTEPIIDPTETVPPTELTPAPTLPAYEPVSFEEAVASNDLRTQREWFFDFARQYQIDYIPQFTKDEGVPTDTPYILYWCYTIDAFEPGEIYGTMSKEYVEETVFTYFGKELGTHQSYHKSWTYDEETGLYKVWPEGGKPDGLFVLDSFVENTDGGYTVIAYQYHANTAYLDENENRIARNTILDTTQSIGIKSIALTTTTVALEPIAEVTLTFIMDPDTSLPLFQSLSATMLAEYHTWVE